MGITLLAVAVPIASTDAFVAVKDVSEIIIFRLMVMENRVLFIRQKQQAHSEPKKEFNYNVE